MVGEKVVVKLALDCSFYDLGDNREYGHKTKILRIYRVAGFMDRVHEGVFPGGRYVVVHDAGVDEEKKDMAYGIKGKLENADAESVGTASRGVTHAGDDTVKGTQTDRVKILPSVGPEGGLRKSID